MNSTITFPPPAPVLKLARPSAEKWAATLAEERRRVARGPHSLDRPPRLTFAKAEPTQPAKRALAGIDASRRAQRTVGSAVGPPKNQPLTDATHNLELSVMQRAMVGRT